MKLYATFYTESTGYVAGSLPPRFEPSAIAPVPACGDRGTIAIDNRLSIPNAVRVARKTCTERGYLGFSLIAGESLLSASDIRPYEAVREIKR